jgi:hypothetical protein
MPDRVKLTSGIPRCYSDTHVQIIEQQNPQSTAQFALKALKKDIKKHDNATGTLISAIVGYVESTRHGSLLKRMPNYWDDIHERIESMALLTANSRRFVNLAADACRRVIMEIEEGRQVDNLEHAIKKQFLLDVWHARFVAPLGLSDAAADDMDEETRSYQVEQVSIYLEQEIDNWLLGIKQSPPENLLEIDIMGGDF